MKFKIVELSEASKVFELTSNCAKKLLENGIQQWDNTYPSLEIITSDIASKSVQGIYLQTRLLGIYVLDQNQSPEYASVAWKYNEKPICVIHRMAVDPNSQGIGLGIKLLKHAEEKAKKLGYQSIRLDAFKGNKPLLRFYEKRGYQAVGEIPLEYTSGPFICFEKKL